MLMLKNKLVYFLRMHRCNFNLGVYAGSPYWRGSLSTVYLLVLTNLEHLFYNANTIYVKTKQVTLIRRSTVLCLPLQLVFPGSRIFVFGKMSDRSGNTKLGLRLSTVDLLIKIACFVKEVNNIFSIKRSWSKLVSTRRSVVLGLLLK